MNDQSPSGVEGSLTSTWDDDTRLVKRCMRGEEPAWTELVSKYKNLIFSIPIKYGFSQEEAADIFQSICLDMVNELAGLREPRALAGWLIRVTHNKCCHHIKEKRRFGPMQDDQPEPAIPISQIPENVLRDIQKEQQFRSAFRALNARCQRLLTMLFFESPPRPYTEIAKSLTLATGSIGFIRARCLGRLRKQLQERGIA